jgi:hypothetical protein
LADANAFFQNKAVDYGALSALGTSTLQLDISLTITEAAAGGYDFGMPARLAAPAVPVPRPTMEMASIRPTPPRELAVPVAWAAMAAVVLGPGGARAPAAKAALERRPPTRR